MNKNAKIYVAGHTGLVGSAVMQTLVQEGYCNLVVRTMQELDLRNQQAVNAFFAVEQPEYVFLLAARVGGIYANDTYPADFIYDNLAMTTNVVNACHVYHVKKLLFFGSSCIYPRLCPQPIDETYLMTGNLEQTNQWYAVAKIAGLYLCQAYRKQYNASFISCMPTNLYGPGDNFDEKNSHVISGLIRRIYSAHSTDAPSVEIWGSGKQRREFLYVDDVAQAALFLMNFYNDALPLNIGTGVDVSIAELAHLIKNIIGYKGTLHFDTTKPDGTPQKLLNVERITKLGWKAQVKLEDGLLKTIIWYTHNYLPRSSTYTTEKSYEHRY